MEKKKTIKENKARTNKVPEPNNILEVTFPFCSCKRLIIGKRNENNILINHVT